MCNAKEFRVLRELISGEWTHKADFGPNIGQTTIDGMLKKKWMTPEGHEVTSELGYRITDAGRDAYRLYEKPKKKRPKTKLKMLKPLLPEPQPRPRRN
jgi:hypothetical protein